MRRLVVSRLTRRWIALLTGHWYDLMERREHGGHWKAGHTDDGQPSRNFPVLVLQLSLTLDASQSQFVTLRSPPSWSANKAGQSPTLW